MSNEIENKVTDQLTPEELQNPKLTTVSELEAEEKIEDVLDIDADDLNVKNYVKINSTFYIQPLLGEENKNLFKILNPETGVVEKRELTDNEKHDVYVLELKQSRKRFNPIKHPVMTTSLIASKNKMGRTVKEKIREVQTNVTTNQFDSAYKQKRKRKNKMAKASRRANRK